MRNLRLIPTKTNPIIPEGAQPETLAIKDIIDLLKNGTRVTTTFGVNLSAKALAKRKDQNGMRPVLVVRK